MPPMSMAASPAVLAFASFFAARASGQPFTFFDDIAVDFLGQAQNLPNEASGIDVAPDGSHLVVASDDGKIFFLNLLDYSSGHCMVDLSSSTSNSDFEGVAIDTGTWTANDKNAYIVHEGGQGDAPLLLKVDYTYDNNGGCTAAIVLSTSLYGAIPCLTTANGIESISLKSPSSGGDPAVFFVGVQDAGKVYEVTSAGASNGPDCVDGGLGVGDVSASAWDGQLLWSFHGNEAEVALVDPTLDCAVATYGIAPVYDREGLAIDFANGMMYVAVDRQGGTVPSVVSAYNFTYPNDLDASAFCCGDGACGGSEDCRSCPRDCDGREAGNPKRRFCCEADAVCVGPGCDGQCAGGGLGYDSCGGFAVCGAAPVPAPTPPPTPCLGQVDGPCSGSCSGCCYGYTNVQGSKTCNGAP